MWVHEGTFIGGLRSSLEGTVAESKVGEEVVESDNRPVAPEDSDSKNSGVSSDEFVSNSPGRIEMLEGLHLAR